MIHETLTRPTVAWWSITEAIKVECRFCVVWLRWGNIPEWRSALFPMFCKSRQCHIFFPVTLFTTTNYVPIVWNHILLLSWNAWGCLWKLPLCVLLPIQSRSENEPNARAHVSAMVLLIIKLQGSCYSFRYPSILLHEQNPLFRVAIGS
jgi:hypothetical protein